MALSMLRRPRGFLCPAEAAVNADQLMPIVYIAVGFFMGYYFRDAADWLLLRWRPVRRGRRHG